LARNKFHPPKKGFNNVITCECSSINSFSAGENKYSSSKRVGDNCTCKIGTNINKTKTKKAFRVFVTDKSSSITGYSGFV
jgi:hypothetical protein